MGKVERGQELSEQVDAFVGELEEQLAQGHTQEFLEVLEYYQTHFTAYSITNCKLIKRQCGVATQCAGYKQWEKLGCQVRQGEKAIWILAPWLRKETDPDTGEVGQRLIGYIGVTVFDISQVDGADKLPTHRHPLSGNYQALYDQIRAAAIRSGIEVQERPLSVLLKGRSFIGSVEIDSDQSASDKCLTLLHELGHEVLHGKQERVEMSDSQRELEAEAVSFVMAGMLGLENPYSRDYIRHWGGKVEGLRASLNRIHQACKTIYGWLETEETPALAAD